VKCNRNKWKKRQTRLDELCTILKWFLIAATYITVCVIVVFAINAMGAKGIIIGIGMCMHAMRQLNPQIQTRVRHIPLPMYIDYLAKQ
jgi:predicted membrane channel-forming protein YqfA (hemolysin III family)